MGQHVAEVGASKNLAATGAVIAGKGQLLGFIVCSGTGVTVKLWDNASAASGQTLVDTVTPAVGVFTRVPAAFANGVYATIAGTTPSVQFFYTQVDR